MALMAASPRLTPKIISGDQIFRAKIGDKLILPCKVSESRNGREKLFLRQVAHLGGFVLMWKRGQRVITADKLVVRKDERIALRDDYSLIINDLRAEDQGSWQCEVDALGKPVAIEHSVSVFKSFSPKSGGLRVIFCKVGWVTMLTRPSCR